MHTNAHMNSHMHTYMHTHLYALPLTPICMLSLVMSQLRICLQVTINLSHLGIGPHRNQANNLPQQNAWKTPAENWHAQWSSDQRPTNSIKISFPTGTPPPPHPTKANHSPSPHTNQPSDRKGLTQRKLTWKH